VAGTPGTLPIGWSVANPAGLTRTLAITNINGVSCLDINWSGTTTSSNLFFLQLPRFAAATGQTWTHSAFTQVTVDDAAVNSLTIQIVEEDASFVFLNATTTNLYPTRTTFARRFTTRVFNQATTANVRASYASNSISSGVAVNFTLRIGLPMLNQGELTSPIVTTNAGAITRAGDVLNVPIDDIGAGADWTLCGVARMPTTPDNTSETLFNFGSGSDLNNRFIFRRNAAPSFSFGSVGAGTLDSRTIPTPSAGAVFGWSMCRSGPQLLVSINGGAPVNFSPTVMPTANTQLWVGCNALGTGQFNADIAELLQFGGAANDATLRAYSTPSTWGVS
jgi:hypothetical protein